MLKSSALLAVISLAIPLSGATISGVNQLILTFNQNPAVGISFTNDEDSNIDFTLLAGPPALSIGGSVSGNATVLTLFTRNNFEATVGPGTIMSVSSGAKAEAIVIRNSGNSEANVLIDFVLTMNGTAGGPGTAQFLTRSLVETQSGSNPWTTFFDASIGANSSGALTVVDYCVSPNSCSGQFSLTVPVNSLIRVRSILSSEGLVSEPEVPEPSAFLLAGAGLSALLLGRRRFRK